MMIDVTTKQPVTVLADDPAYPYVMVPFVQLRELLTVLDAHQLPYEVEDEIISIDDGPEVAVVNFKRGANARFVQDAIDKAG